MCIRDRTRAAHAQSLRGAAITWICLHNNYLEIPQSPGIIHLLTFTAKEFAHGVMRINAPAAGVVVLEEVPRRIFLWKAEAHLEDAVKLVECQRVRETNLAVHFGVRADVGDLAEQGASGVATIGADLRQICDL